MLRNSFSVARLLWCNAKIDAFLYTQKLVQKEHLKFKNIQEYSTKNNIKEHSRGLHDDWLDVQR